MIRPSANFVFVTLLAFSPNLASAAETALSCFSLFLPSEGTTELALQERALIVQRGSNRSVAAPGSVSDLRTRLHTQLLNQDSIVVNPDGRTKVELVGSEPMKLFKEIARGLNGLVNQGRRHFAFNANLTFKESIEMADPRSPELRVTGYVFEQLISDSTQITAILIERGGAGRSQYDDFIVRFSSRKGENISVVDVPYIYQYFGTYEHLDRKNVLVDYGTIHTFNTEIAFRQANVHFSGSQIEIKKSEMVKSRDPEIKISFYAIKK